MINGRKVEFKLKELPNDMKILAFLAGELSNGATFFTTFANVSIHNHRDVTKLFRKDWLPFPYEKRMEVTKRVTAERTKLLARKLADSTVTTKINNFIKTLGSRQSEIPLVEELEVFAKPDPLKNNICKEYFLKVSYLTFF